MAQDVPLTDLPVGSTFKLKGRIASDDGTTMVVELLQDDGSTHGAMDITKATGAMTGQLTVAMEDTQVEPVAIAYSVGDVLEEVATGRTLVVRAVGLGPHGDKWSDSTGGRMTYSAEGWQPAGTWNQP
jgi:hypothetical protein